MNLRCPLVLASASPRRKKLLEQIGLVFSIQVSDVDEHFDENEIPSEIVQKLATKKAAAIAPQHPQSITLAADTIVVLEGQILGKPANENDAVRMLTRLSGKSHTVYTGLALFHPSSSRTATFYEATQVTFGALTSEEIASYVATRSPLDKAGAYGIQDDLGAIYISAIQGDYYNVVGLPLHRLYMELKSSFNDLLIV